MCVVCRRLDGWTGGHIKRAESGSGAERVCVNLGDAVATPRTSRIVRTYGHTRIQVNGEKKRDAGIGTGTKHHRR